MKSTPRFPPPVLARQPVMRRVMCTWQIGGEPEAYDVEAWTFMFRGCEFFIHRKLRGAADPVGPTLPWRCSHGQTGFLVHHNPEQLTRSALLHAACERLAAHWHNLPAATKGKPIINT